MKHLLIVVMGLLYAQKQKYIILGSGHFSPKLQESYQEIVIQSGATWVGLCPKHHVIIAAAEPTQADKITQTLQKNLQHAISAPVYVKFTSRPEELLNDCGYEMR